MEERDHKAHWNALFGNDWSLETPSLLYSEVDESELVDEADSLQWLRKEDGIIELHSFIAHSKLIKVYPLLKSREFSTFQLLEALPWEEDFNVEKTVVLMTPKQSQLRAFSGCFPGKTPEINESGEIQLGLSAFCYSLSPSNSHSSWAPIESMNDDTTSYRFSGAKVISIENTVSFYHNGWLTELEIPIGEDEKIRVLCWIHRKNTTEEPVPGLKYEGSLWLQCCSSPSN